MIKAPLSGISPSRFPGHFPELPMGEVFMIFLIHLKSSFVLNFSFIYKGKTEKKT